MDIFGDVDESLPEIEIFDKLANPAEAELAIKMYYALRKNDVEHSEAVELAASDPLPLRYVDSEGQ